MNEDLVSEILRAEIRAQFAMGYARQLKAGVTIEQMAARADWTTGRFYSVMLADDSLSLSEVGIMAYALDHDIDFVLVPREVENPKIKEDVQSWAGTYHPLAFEKGRGFDFGEGPTVVDRDVAYGYNLHFVWSVFIEDREVRIMSGYHDGCQGYIVTLEPWSESTTVTIHKFKTKE